MEIGENSDYLILKYLSEGVTITGKKLQSLTDNFSSYPNAWRKLKQMENESLIIQTDSKAREAEFKITDLGKLKLQHFEEVKKRKMEKVEKLKEEETRKMSQQISANMHEKEIAQELAEFFSMKKDFVRTEILNGRVPVFSFNEIDSFSPKAGDFLLANPKEFFNLAYQEMNSSSETEIASSLMISEFPDSIEVPIPRLRSSDVGKLVKVKGVIRRASLVFSVPIRTEYLCKECGNPVEVRHTLFDVKRIKKCPLCEASLSEVNVEKEDRMKIDLEEDISNVTSEPKRLLCYLQPFLCKPQFYEKLKQLGSRIEFVGVIKEKATKISDGDSYGLIYQKYLDTISVKWSQEDFPSIETTPEDEANIQEFSRRPDLLSKLTDALAPSIKGVNEIKTALILQQFGGINYPAKEGEPARRGVIHIYLGGDPSTGKSQMGRAMAQLAPRVRYAVGGKGSSSDTTFGAAAKQDKETKEWYFEGGVLITANGGLCVIDEGHECSDEQLNSLKEPLEQMTVTKNAAGINAQFKAETGVLFIANPKYDFFDLNEPFSEQLRIPPALLSRFDYKFIMLDRPDKEKDARAISSMFKIRHESPSQEKEDNLSFVRKYIAYAKRKINKVTIPATLQDKITEYVLGLRSKQNAGREYERPKILLRNVESIIRSVEASAKMRLSDVATEQDWELVRALYNYQMNTFGIDPETGKFDIDQFEGRMGTSKVKKLKSSEELFDSLCAELDVKELERKYFLRKIEETFSRTPAEAERSLETLMNAGILFSPKWERIARVK